MTSAQLCMLILTVIVLACSVRMLWQYQAQARTWRVWLLLLLQAGSAALLYLTLFPPNRTAPAQRVQILTANVLQKAVLDSSSVRVLALPEANRNTAAQRVPDLATVLRQFPNVNELEILGDGLTVRDQDAARGMAIKYQAKPIEQGIIELGVPAPVVPGEQWTVSGRVAQAHATVELLDPGDMVVDSLITDNTGLFSLADTARGIGNALYQVRVRDAKKKIIETVIVPVSTLAPQKLNLLSISGGVNPELKYLKRWALDAEVSLQSSVSLGLGMQIQSAPLALNQDSLRNVDLVILDERAWMAMNASSQQVIRSALQGGMGVLLRLTGPLSNSASAQWRAIGFDIRDANIVQALRLTEPNQQKKLPELMRQSVTVSSSDAVPLLSDNRGEALGLWRAYGLGRVGVWWLNDSYRLVLAGNQDVYGAMWSEITSTLARAKQKTFLHMPSHPIWMNERAVFCGLTENANITSPEGDAHSLLIETQGVNKNCATFWPKHAGWHELKDAGQSRMFYVRAATDAVTLHRSLVQQATMSLAGLYKPTLSKSAVAVPGEPWPYFIAWLLLTTMLWWLERIRWAINK